MGIYTRYATAVLVLFTSSAFSATRVPVKPTSETVITGARTGAVSTPAGDVAFYGADKVYSFTAGDSVAPTVREVKSTVGSVSYPYGPGAAYPNDPTYSASAATKIKVKPVAVVPKNRISTGLKKLVKLNPGQILLGVATSAAVSAVGWVMSDDQTKLQKKEIPSEPVTTDPTKGQYSWKITNLTGDYSSPYIGCEKFRVTNTVYVSTDIAFTGTSTGNCKFKNQSGATITSSAFTRSGSTCPANSTYDSTKGACFGPATQVDLVESDFDKLDPWVSSQTASFLGDLLKEVCKASLSPANCYAEMEDRSKRTLQGPATAAGPWFTKTSTFPKPDGTTGTKTETTSTKYDFTYGPEHFDVNPERKTTTTEDGVVTSETTETDGTPAEDVADTPDEETPPEESYTFNDSDLPTVEPFYIQKYPDGFQGVWNSAKSDFDQSAFVSFLNSFVPSFSGSCPAFSMSFAIGNVANFGTHDFGNLCYALDFVKVCIMLGALFLCRAIVFGG
jgi:hypothetical protein